MATKGLNANCVGWLFEARHHYLAQRSFAKDFHDTPIYLYHACFPSKT